MAATMLADPRLAMEGLSEATRALLGAQGAALSPAEVQVMAAKYARGELAQVVR